ncbi:MAG: response regulator, partial [Lachnospiraceae bacterium]|nr:response regulator [Lachnospiraceae bacterium]
VEMNLKVIRSLMKNSEAELDFALTGENAFSLCKKKKYDIIFMDHMMPEMDGIETLKKIRESDDSLNKDTPVIVMTANAAADAEEDYQAIGFADYIMKPFGMGPLKKTIQKNIRRDSKDR